MAQPMFTGGDWPGVPSTPSSGGMAVPGGAGSSSSSHSRSRGALVRSTSRAPGLRPLPDGPLRALGEVSGPLLAAHVPLMLGDSPVAEAQCLPLAHMPRPAQPVWHSMSSQMPEVMLRAEIADLTRALQSRNADLQRVTQSNAEAQGVIAAARAEVQRLSNEEAHASYAVGVVQQQTALRAGFLGEHAQEAYALYQRECLAVQQLQEASVHQYSAFNQDAARLRNEFAHAQRVFGEMQQKDAANQHALQQLQAMVTSGQLTASNFTQYEQRVQLAVSDLKTELQTAISTVVQQQRNLDALAEQNRTAHEEIRQASEQRRRLEEGFQNFHQIAIRRDDERTREFEAVLQRHRHDEASSARNLNEQLTQRLNALTAKHESEVATCERYYQDLKQYEYEWNAWEASSKDEAKAAKTVKPPHGN